MSNLTPKFKAKELFIKFKHQIEYNNQPSIVNMVAIECALLAVEEIFFLLVNTYDWDEKHNGNVNYWQEVKQELINLKNKK